MKYTAMETSDCGLSEMLTSGKSLRIRTREMLLQQDVIVNTLSFNSRRVLT